jgi:ribonucleoside-diphosphate reductase alpha chain
MACYLGLGEDAAGKLCEVFITCNKEGTLVRGLLDALARVASTALQCGASPGEVAKSLRHCNFPPNGAALRNGDTLECSSIADWVAQEIEAAYGDKDAKARS